MSYSHTIVRYITVDIDGEEKYVEKLFNALHDMFHSPSCEWSMEYQLTTDAYKYTLIGKETGKETVYPGCMYMSNGDPGYPDEYEDDLTLCEDTIEEFISEFAESNNTEFTYLVHQEDESGDYLDY